MMRVVTNVLVIGALVGLIIGSTPGMAYALEATATPQGGTVVAGSATFDRPGNSSLNVNQSSQRAVIEWQSFNVGESASVEFRQPNASALAVNRVTGAGTDPTQVLGTLKSNGQVMVLDRNGVIFGAHARVDVGGLIASTGTVDNAQVMSGAQKIDITSVGGTGAVVNQGQISAADGGLVALVAPHVANSGTITANLGRVELAAGNAVTVDLYGDKLVSLAVNGDLANALVENSGAIAADGGRVALTARAAQGVVDNVINTTGIVRANAVGTQNGRIVLSGGNAGTVRVEGAVSAVSDASTGGRIDVTGRQIAVSNAQMDVSGATGGGQIYIGGGMNGVADNGDSTASVTDVSSSSTLRADATDNGNGGSVVIWGNDHTGYYGTTTAHGGAQGGNGGFVEISTGKGVDFQGLVDTMAPQGDVGTLLIDPTTVSIGNGVSQGDGTYLNATQIANALKTTSIVVQADDTISILDPADLSVSRFTLSLVSDKLNVNANLTMGLTNHLNLTNNTLNLNGRILGSTGAVINPTRITGTATRVNILSAQASIQQGIDISSKTAPVTVAIAPGQYQENIIIAKNGVTLAGIDATGTDGADINAPDIFGTVAGGDVITVAANNVTIHGLHIHAQVGDGSLTDSVNAVAASSVDQLTVSHNTIEGFSDSGVKLTNVTNSTVSANQSKLSPAQYAAAKAAADAAAAAAAQAAATAAATAAAADAADTAAQAAATAAAQAATTAAAQAATAAADKTAADAAAAAAAAASTAAATDAATKAAADATAQAAAQTATQASTDASAQAVTAATAKTTADAAAQTATDAATAAAADATAKAAAAAAAQAAATTAYDDAKAVALAQIKQTKQEAIAAAETAKQAAIAEARATAKAAIDAANAAKQTAKAEADAAKQAAYAQANAAKAAADAAAKAEAQAEIAAINAAKIAAMKGATAAQKAAAEAAAKAQKAAVLAAEQATRDAAAALAKAQKAAASADAKAAKDIATAEAKALKCAAEAAAKAAIEVAKADAKAAKALALADAKASRANINAVAQAAAAAAVAAAAQAADAAAAAAQNAATTAATAAQAATAAVAAAQTVQNAQTAATAAAQAATAAAAQASATAAEKAAAAQAAQTAAEAAAAAATDAANKATAAAAAQTAADAAAQASTDAAALAAQTAAEKAAADAAAQTAADAAAAAQAAADAYNS